MTDKKITQLAEEFESLTIKQQMKILAFKAAKSRLYYKEIMDEFERTLMQAMLEKYDFNKVVMSLGIKMHRNTISQKIKKMKLREKKKKTGL